MNLVIIIYKCAIVEIYIYIYMIKYNVLYLISIEKTFTW